jgi:hypothetical protein
MSFWLYGPLKIWGLPVEVKDTPQTREFGWMLVPSSTSPQPANEPSRHTGRHTYPSDTRDPSESGP